VQSIYCSTEYHIIGELETVSIAYVVVFNDAPSKGCGAVMFRDQNGFNNFSTIFLLGINSREAFPVL